MEVGEESERDIEEYADDLQPGSAAGAGAPPPEPAPADSGQ